MKYLFLAAAIGSVLACKGEESKPGPNAYDRAVVEGQIRNRDCDALKLAVNAAQKRIADKVSGAYSKKAFEELASLREQIAKDAEAVTMGGEQAKAILERWRSLNLRAATAERLVAASLQDAGSDTGTAMSDLTKIAADESKVFDDLAKLCPR